MFRLHCRTLSCLWCHWSFWSSPRCACNTSRPLPSFASCTRKKSAPSIQSCKRTWWPRWSSGWRRSAWTPFTLCAATLFKCSARTCSDFASGMHQCLKLCGLSSRLVTLSLATLKWSFFSQKSYSRDHSLTMFWALRPFLKVFLLACHTTGLSTTLNPIDPFLKVSHFKFGNFNMIVFFAKILFPRSLN